MSLIRRISTSITSSVDRAVSKVENHDAIINAALRDTQHAAISDDDGKTWIGFREFTLDPLRNKNNYAITKGSNDRAQHQGDRARGGHTVPPWTVHLRSGPDREHFCEHARRRRAGPR